MALKIEGLPPKASKQLEQSINVQLKRLYDPVKNGGRIDTLERRCADLEKRLQAAEKTISDLKKGPSKDEKFFKESRQKNWDFAYTHSVKNLTQLLDLQKRLGELEKKLKQKR